LIEKPTTSEKLEEHKPQRKQVGPPVHASTRSLFGRHIGQFALHRSRAGRLTDGGLGHAEIGQFHLACTGYHDVVGRDVSMNDTVFVNIVQRGQNLPGYLSHQARWKGSPFVM
jgi:hypothetical protein